MDYDDRADHEGYITPAVKWILIANLLFYLMQILRGSFMQYWFALWPNAHAGFIPISLREAYAINSFYPWQLVTYAFLHSTYSFTHIFFNMFGLWMFGPMLERTVGTKQFTLYYFVCAIGGGLSHMAYAYVVGSVTPVLGASAAIFGLLLSYGMLFPNVETFILFIPIPIKARTLVILYGLIELLTGIFGIGGGVAHFAHLGGMLFGFFLILYWRKKQIV
jgi:membrane associated rhomboid family serine protease